MKIENQVCTLEQAIKLESLGLSQESHFTWKVNDVQSVVCETKHCYEIISRLPGLNTYYAAYTVSELLKLLPFIIRYDGHDYFMAFGHSQKGYRVVYETQKLGLVFNLDDELDREKKALFSTMRSGKIAAQVLAEYLRMLLESDSAVLSVDDINQRLINS